MDMSVPDLRDQGFWNLMMGIFTLYCTICALRTNVMFCAAFFFLMFAFVLVAAAEWTGSEGHLSVSKNLQTVSPPDIVRSKSLC